MPFNFYFAGVFSKPTEEELENTNSLRLLSYWYDKKAFQKRVEKGLKTFLDSGAFTAWTKGVAIDVDEYISYVDANTDGIEFFCQVDTIPKTKEEANSGTTLDNYAYMLQKVKSPEKLLPVFHYGTHFEQFEKLFEVNPELDYVCLGALVGVPKTTRDAFFDKFFTYLKTIGKSDLKVHALGMTSLDLLEKYPFHSADSTTWLSFARNGLLLSHNGHGNIQVGERTNKDPNNLCNREQQVQDSIMSLIEKYGLTWEDVSTSRDMRAIYNIRFLHDWIQNYQPKPKALGQIRLF